MAKALALVSNLLDIGVGVMLIIRSVINIFQFTNFPATIANIFLLVSGFALVIVASEFINVGLVKEVFSVYFLFIGRGIIFILYALCAGIARTGS